MSTVPMRWFSRTAAAALALLSSLPLWGAGNGLKGEYFGNTGFVGTPVAVRTDANVNFLWLGSPAPGVANNYFSVRWTGKVEAPVDGTYKFVAESSPGMRVWVDGNLVIDHWAAHMPAQKTSDPIHLIAGQQYDIKVETYDLNAMTVARLRWEYPGQSATLIPQELLYSPVATPWPAPVYLSELTPTFDDNGWGQYEPDRSNGGSRYRDGRTIKINDVQYGRGLGVHARSELRYNLNRAYQTFFADIGVDDEVENEGSVMFEVWVDGVRKYLSLVRKGKHVATPIAVNVAGAMELKLIVVDAGDGSSSDNADWGAARVVNAAAVPTPSPDPNSDPDAPPPTPASPSNPTPPQVPAGFTATPASGKVTLTWSPSSGADGYILYRGTTSSVAAYKLGLTGASYVDTAVTNGTTYFYAIAAVKGGVSSALSAIRSAQPMSTSTPPAAPASLSATAGNAMVNLTWPPVAGAASYNLYRSTTSGVAMDAPVKTGITGTSVTDTGLSNGTTYYYKVAAVNASGVGARSPQASATPAAPQPPPAPASLSATPGNAKVTLVWPAVTGAASYNLYRGTVSGGQGDAPYKTGLTGTSVVDTSVTNGTTYFYKLAAVNSNGTGARSPEASAKPVAPELPAAPASLSATAGDAQVTLTWPAVSAATSYNLYRGTTSGGQSSTPVRTGLTGTSVVDSGLTNGTTYFYKLAAVNANGVSAKSPEASAKPAKGPVPPAPTGLTATAGNAQVTLTWTASEGATSYYIYRSTTSNGQGDTPLATGLVTKTTYVSPSLINGTTYYFRVAAVNANGVSAKSNQASAKPKAPPLPSKPTGFSATGGDRSITLTWDAVPDAITYNLYRSTTSNGQGDTPYRTGITATTFADTGLANGTTYYYKLAGVNTTGVGTKSLQISATPFAAAPVLSDAQKANFKFLRQATWGPTPALMTRVAQVGKEGFLNEQFNLPATPYPQALIDMPNMELVSEQFFQNALQGQDQLRQRVAWALSQIWVASAVKVDNTHAMVPYIRILQENAFGNVRNLLEQVTLSPAMGEFLDMVNNKKANPETGAMPNENYARELMQLFTIGLTGLNPDGTPNGQPTYTQNDILELSRVLTGWTYGDTVAGDPTRINSPYYNGPMEPAERYHDTGAKTVLGANFPAGQNARADLKQALDLLFNHGNMPPFFAKHMIQRLVKSDPTPAYVGRVAAAFINNGQGVRGDMRAIVRAVLLDPEAAATPGSGKFSEPALFLLTFARGLNSTVTDHPYLTDFSQDMGQRIWFAPSVFNYFSPGYRLNGVLGPELQIWSTATAMTRTNFVASLVSGGFGNNFVINTTPYQAVAGSPEALVDTANALLMGGTMSTEMRQAILTALATTSTTDRIRTVLYLVGSSMQYQVEH